MSRLPLTVALLAAALAAPLAAQQHAFVITLGRDTSAVEQFTITPARIEGEGVFRQPRTSVRRFSVEMGPDGRPTRGTVALFAPGVPASGTPTQRATLTLTRDSMVTETRRDTATQVQRRAVPPGPVVPAFGGVSSSFVAYEVIAERLHGMRNVDSATFMTTNGPWRAGRVSRDTIWIYDGNNRFHMHVDGSGRILHAVPLSGTQQFYVARVASADIGALATAFGARDQQGQNLGALSTRDTLRATVAGATLWVDYGRPAKRGRAIFGSSVVPYDSIWRLGANAATQLRTDRALEIGGVVLQPGLYTLWAVPQRGNTWKLLINSQAGQWGTAHDATKDLFNLDLAVTTLPQPVERFTIGVTPTAQGGTLTFDWDTTRASIPFTVR